MQTFLPLAFIREKIDALQQALFFNSSTALLKFPVHVIDVLCTDDIGQIWFYIPRPLQSIHEFEKEFPAKLDFFRKGKPFYMKVQGKAFIVTDPEELNNCSCIDDDTKQKARSMDLVLIKIRIEFADYFENAPAEAPVGFPGIKPQLFTWLFSRHNHYFEKKAFFHYKLS